MNKVKHAVMGILVVLGGLYFVGAGFLMIRPSVFTPDEQELLIACMLATSFLLGLIVHQMRKGRRTFADCGAFLRYDRIGKLEQTLGDMVIILVSICLLAFLDLHLSLLNSISELIGR